MKPEDCRNDQELSRKTRELALRVEESSFTESQRLVALEELWKTLLLDPPRDGLLASPNAPTPVVSAGYQRTLEDFFGDRIPSSFLGAWHQALAHSNIPIDFAAGYSFDRFTFQVDGEIFPAISLIGVDHEVRRKVISSTPQHSPRRSFDSYGYRFDSACLLDPNIIQALDAREHPQQVYSNALAEFGPYIWLVNKFPWYVGDTLLLAKNHDDMSTRAQFLGAQRSWHRTSTEQTRGAIPSAEYLTTVFAVCARFDQSAHRNHALDGMSVPLHDHFKLLPSAHPSFALLPEMSIAPDAHKLDVIAYRAMRTPFDTLCLSSSASWNLAAQASALLASLEANDQIYTLQYHRNTLFITPRRAELYGDGRPDAWTGSGVGAHVIENPDHGSPHMRRILQYTARQREFPWEKFLENLDIRFVHDV